MLKLYRVFNTEQEVAEANGRWLYAKYKAGDFEMIMDKPAPMQKTTCWDYGKIMKDGRIACDVPAKFANEFAGIELELTKNDFPVIEGEV